MTLTPETLRAQARHHRRYGRNVVASQMDNAADAWEADYKLAGDYHNMANEYLALRKQLEAAETELRAANKEMALQTERSLSSWVIDALVKRGFQVVPPALAGEE